MKIIYKKIEDLVKYKNNPRNNENSIKEVAKSIKEFGFKVPILIDKDNVIICGHTRYDASKLLNLIEVPCILIEDLDEQQIKAFRLADNKVAEFAKWDYEKLKKELKQINNSLINFDFYDELDVTDEDFLKNTEIIKEIKIKEYRCPKCGEIFE